MEGDEPVLSEENERKAVYKALAGDIPLIQEVVEGLTTFREALDEIVYELGHPQHKCTDESVGMALFRDYLMVLEALTGEFPMTGQGMDDVDHYNGDNCTDIRKFIQVSTIVGGGGSAGCLAAGLVLERLYPVLGEYLKITGLAGLMCTPLFRGACGIRSAIWKSAAMKWITPLYEIADTLDAEVAELYRTEE